MISHPPFPASAAPGTVRPVLQPFFLSPHKVVPDDRPTAATTRNNSAKKTVTDTARSQASVQQPPDSLGYRPAIRQAGQLLGRHSHHFPHVGRRYGSRLGDDIAERRLQLRGG